MIFTSPQFLLLFFLAWLGWRFSPRAGYVLLAASLVNYLAAGWSDWLLVLAMVAANYAASFLIGRVRYWLALVVAANLAILAYFKYRGFLFGDTSQFSLFTGEIIIPLGISFYTFQIIAYQVDIARGIAQRQTSLPKFALFILFFPQVIAGPIMRAKRFAPQISNTFDRRLQRHGATFRHTALSLSIILLGLFKKVILADSLAPHVDAIFALGPADAAAAWLGAWLFAFQIYFDFSGYSDMAVGMARLFRIRLPFNFRQPYLSATPREFWRRWHITLSEWIRDYVYVPLGGSRHKHWLISGAVVVASMSLAGLWHGANNTFIVWGALWGMIILVHRGVGGLTKRTRLLSWAVTFFVVILLWVPFRSPSIGFAIDYISVMFGGAPLGDWSLPRDAGLKFSVLLGCASLIGLHWLERRAFRFDLARLLVRWDGPLLWGIIVGLIVLTVIKPNMSSNPFIYFRF